MCIRDRDIYPEYTGNGAFFFKDENDAAWKNAQQGYEKVKKLDAEQNKLKMCIRDSAYGYQ